MGIRCHKAEQAAATDDTGFRIASNTVLVSDAWAAYLAHHSNRWGMRHLTDHRNLSQKGGSKKKRGTDLTVQGVLYPLMSLRIADISAAVLIDWQVKESSTRANSTRQGFELFRTFWRWAGTCPKYASVIDKGIMKDRELRDKVPTRKTRRTVVLRRAHLRSWFVAVRRVPNPIASAYLQTLILTGARRREMAELRWRDVDLKNNNLWIRGNVVGGGRRIPLTPYLSELIAALPRTTKWVFSSPTAADGHLAEPRFPHNRALSSAGLQHVTLNGLRRTFASLAEHVHIPPPVVAKIMGHAVNTIAEKEYADSSLDVLTVWHAKYEAWMLREAGIQRGNRNPKHQRY
jgi:integrase